MPASPAPGRRVRHEGVIPVLEADPVSPGPTDLAGCRRGAEWALVAATAMEVGLVGALAAGPASPDDVAARLGLSPRGTRILLGALEELGLVRSDPDGVRLTGEGRARLVDRDTPDFEADSLRFWLLNLRRWTDGLPEATRTGQPQIGPGGRSPEGLAAFMAAMASKSRELVEAVVRGTLERAPAARTALDLGGGPGTFARAFARHGLRAVLFDQPEVVEHVRGAYDLDQEPDVELRAGDFLEAFPEGTFDIVFVGNITHIYDRDTNRDLIESCAGALSPGGVLAVLDFVRGEAPFAALFAVTMLLNSRHGGDTYDRSTYETWMLGAGLRDVRLRRVDEDRHLITALRSA
jgi:SAM-dependent methyltransferase